MNKAVGDKIEWRMISNPSRWWKAMLIHKYFKREDCIHLDLLNWNEKDLQFGSYVKHLHSSY